MKTAESLLCVRYSSIFSLEELNEICLSDLENFRSVPGLIQKYFVTEEYTGAISNIYLFESKMTRAAFSVSDLAKDIPSRYRMIPDTIRVEYYDTLIVLNEE
ncbi:MAG TPA: hypothetical protein VGI38_01595 [Puia sp.]|jgi:hypothetical protein